ncbi:hypothetical protein RUM44_013562 [Polyplax serrata]|uniref:DUF4774 domain-containing protein n=1 Tax=Polyplax serrata TaxID=468196 RepID=A0ABR1BIF1_POLSC
MSDVKKNGKSDEKVVTSPVLDVKETSSGRSQKPNLEFVKIETYPGTAHLVNRYNVDGSLKSSQTHFHPDFGWKKNVRVRGGVIDQDYVEKQVNDDQERRYALGNRLEENQKTDAKKFATFSRQSVREDHIWPFGDLLKRGRNDLLDLLLAWDFESPTIYTAVSSIVEYQPGEEQMREEEEKYESDLPDEGGKKNLGFALNSNFEIVRSKSEKGKEVDRIERRPLERTRNVGEERRSMRNRRDVTSIYLKSKDGVKVDISLEEPKEITPKRKKLGESELVLRKGGIAIAGPGGAATAYTGGTAIVGPYGTVYKSPEGTAIVGPYSKIVNITDDTDFEEIIKLHKELQQSPSPSVERGDSTPEAKGFKNYKNIFSYLTNQPLRIEMTPPRGSTERKRPTVVRLKENDLERTVEEAFRLNFRGLVQEAPFNEQTINKNETSLVFRPKSKAEAGRNGVAVSAPISHAILFPGHKANIYFEPESVASAGPSGFAHAHSDFHLAVENENLEPEARGFGAFLPNTPPLGHILRPPNQESRQFLGYTDKKNKNKPMTKPAKEEEGSEEVSEEEQEENMGQVGGGLLPNGYPVLWVPFAKFQLIARNCHGNLFLFFVQENASDGVSISTPPDGASVAEAKPIGLAIAGPGGVAASKPQGTAVVGPGGLAIARPVGTAIAGVEVEGSVPIGGSHKNKKKPKQEEQADAELHYVGGLTGPIGHPQPKEFPDGASYKNLRTDDETKNQERLFFHGRHNSNGFQLKLGQIGGKYGFIPAQGGSQEETRNFQKRLGPKTYFQGPLGHSDDDDDSLMNYQF